MNLTDIANTATPTLTSFSESGGCSCKLGPDELRQICEASDLREARPLDHQDDDAAIFRLKNGQYLLSSVDFQNPIVDDAEISGEIAANNAMSDIWACGAEPQQCEVILALPQHVDETTRHDIGVKIMNGISRACRVAGCAIVGGHTVLAYNPLLGLAVRGIAAPRNIRLKSAARAGDYIALTRPLGTGVLVAAQQAGVLRGNHWEQALAALRTPNRVGARLGRLKQVHAMTDVTGFGLLGHLDEVVRTSGCRAEIDLRALPVLDGARQAVRSGFSPLLAQRNRDTFRASLGPAGGVDPHELLLLSDPQTNGPLLMTFAPEALSRVRAACAEFGHAISTIGRIATRDAGPLISVI